MNDEFAPITSEIGFLRLPLSAAADAMTAWRKRLYRDVTVTEVREPFPDVLRKLEPLQSRTQPREILVAVGEWTAYMSCGLRGTDADSAVGHLSRTLGCRALTVRAVPGTIGIEDPGRYGSLRFTMFGPDNEGIWLNTVRTIHLSQQTSRWEFEAHGTVQGFEELEAYQSRRVRDRFTSDMLVRYCRALDLDVFNPSVYGPEAVLFESYDYQLPVPGVPAGMRGGVLPTPPGGDTVLSLRDAQSREGIVPGLASTLPG